MRKLSFFITLASLLVLSFGLANAQGFITLEPFAAEVTPASPGVTGQVECGVPIEFAIRIDNQTGAFATGWTTGFHVYSSAPYSPLVASYNGAVDWTGLYFDGGVFVNEFSVTGAGADTVGFGGFKLFKTGYPTGQSDIAFFINTQVSCADVDAELCLDSAFYPPQGTFQWSVAGVGTPPVVWGQGPGESQPLCWTIYEVPNKPPVFDNCQASNTYDHCAIATYDFDAHDQDALPNDPPVLQYSIVSGPGSIDASSGVWSYAPTAGDVGTSQDLVVQVSDGGATAECTMTLNFSNSDVATFVAGCGTNTPVGKGNSAQRQVTATTTDCDPLSYSIANVSPAPVGTMSINPNTGLVTFDTDDADGGNVYTVTVCVSDGIGEVCCDLTFEVLLTEPFIVKIEKTHMTYQGQHEFVDVTVEAGSEQFGGFNFLIAYDASALSFQTAIPGPLFNDGDPLTEDCGWEYFTYRYGADGNCSNACPSGLVRVVGIAETNNGANHPSCFALAPGENLFSLDFLVSDDRTLECQYAPVRFFWMDCGDNTMSNILGDTLFISRYVYDFYDGFGLLDPVNSIAQPYSYPTYFGAQDCDNPNPDKPNAVGFIDFVNGGVDIACADSIDARGDVNLNNIDNEIADAVLFSNYFVQGLGVFTINVEGQIAATDVNADGLALSVADLVYLIRIIVGDALPYAKVAPTSATVMNNNGTMTVDQTMGAAAVTVRGAVTPTLLADNMEMKSSYDAANDVTKILVFSLEANQSFSGAFLGGLEGTVESVEFATYEGGMVNARLVPANFALNQNYPNPFNPSTVISAELPVATSFTIEVFNVAGQKVASYSDFSEAGTIEWEFEASSLASGVYFYKLTAGDYTATEKMVLLK